MIASRPPLTTHLRSSSCWRLDSKVSHSPPNGLRSGRPICSNDIPCHRLMLACVEDVLNWYLWNRFEPLRSLLKLAVAPNRLIRWSRVWRILNTGPAQRRRCWRIVAAILRRDILQSFVWWNRSRRLMYRQYKFQDGEYHCPEDHDLAFLLKPWLQKTRCESFLCAVWAALILLPRSLSHATLFEMICQGREIHRRLLLAVCRY